MNTKTASKAADPEDGIIVGVEENADAKSSGEAPVLERRSEGDINKLKRAIFNVPIEVVVSVGSARPLIGDLLSMGRNYLLPLDSKIDDPVELRVRDKVIARGELSEIPDEDGQLGIRITEVVNISELHEE